MPTANVETVLSRLGLTEIESRTLLERAVSHSLPKDTIVVKKGHRSDALYIILEGRAKAFEIDSSGNETVLSYHGSGDCFGGMGFGEGPISASVMTLEPSQLLMLPTTDLRAFLPKNPLFAARVFETLVKEAEQNARGLSEALQRKTAISEILRAISNSPTDAQSVLDTVAEAAARLCDVTNVEIFQVEGDEVRLVAKHGQYRIWPIGFSFRISREMVVGRTIADAASVHVHDLQAAETDFPQGAVYAKQYGHRTVFATPLLREGVAIGAILIRRLEVRPLTDNQITLLKTFADQAAIAIENVRLFKEIREKSRMVEEQAKELSEWNAALETRVAEQVDQIERLAKLEHELALASEIQKSMLPRSIPQLEGYELGARMIPAKSVGGDFFDFIPLGENLMGIAVGDVADKGVPAALFMAMVRSLLRAEAHPGRPPKKVLRSVSRHLMDMNDKEMFVTILFGILNGAAHQFHYARAGHEAPIFFDRQGSVKRMPKTNGQALGILAEVTLDEQTVELPRGSMLLIYTDGVPDAANRQHVGFGFDGVVRTAGKLAGSSAQVVGDELIRAATEHQAGALQHDDMTVLVMRAV
jgi:serine phosphatase RsbU (regulator of sigma subunit)/CRP-like cAMP-binding protein